MCAHYKIAGRLYHSLSAEQKPKSLRLIKTGIIVTDLAAEVAAAIVLVSVLQAFYASPVHGSCVDVFFTEITRI